MAHPNNLSRSIVERFLSGAELEAFLKAYNEHKKGLGQRNRADYLAVPLSEEDIKIIKFYILEPERNIKELAEELDERIGSVYGKALRIAARILYQNKQLVEDL